MERRLGKQGRMNVFRLRLEIDPRGIMVPMNILTRRAEPKINSVSDSYVQPDSLICMKMPQYNRLFSNKHATSKSDNSAHQYIDKLCQSGSRSTPILYMY